MVEDCAYIEEHPVLLVMLFVQIQVLLHIVRIFLQQTERCLCAPICELFVIQETVDLSRPSSRSFRGVVEKSARRTNPKSQGTFSQHPAIPSQVAINDEA